MRRREVGYPHREERSKLQSTIGLLQHSTLGYQLHISSLATNIMRDEFEFEGKILDENLEEDDLVELDEETEEEEEEKEEEKDDEEEI